MSDSTRVLYFSDTPGCADQAERSTYQLLAVPPDLISTLTSPTTPLEIRGDATDAAALVTPNKTYALRGVQNSNSLCVCSSGRERGHQGKWFSSSSSRRHGRDERSSGDESSSGSDEEPRRKRKRPQQQQPAQDVEIESVLHETLEAVVGVAKTDKLATILNGCEYRGELAEAASRVSLYLFFSFARRELSTTFTLFFFLRS